MPTVQDIQAATQWVASRFIYTAEPREDWSIPPMDGGPIRDDCDGYMLAVMARVYGSERGAAKALMTGRAQAWRCTVGGEGHAVGEIADDAGTVWRFDNIQRGTARRASWYEGAVLYRDWRRFSRFRVALKLWPRLALGLKLAGVAMLAGAGATVWLA